MSVTRRTFAAVTIAVCALSPAYAVDALSNAHAASFISIEGGPLDMADYAGKAVLVVNTASRCGFTGQYKGLQALYDKYREDGLVVLGVPSNDFRQELGSAEEVKEFCEVTYGIDFPMTEIERVTGAEAHPLFRWMAGQDAEPNWNFNKFLIGKDGALIAHHGSTTRPDDPRLIALIEESLAR